MKARTRAIALLGAVGIMTSACGAATGPATSPAAPAPTNAAAGQSVFNDLVRTSQAEVAKKDGKLAIALELQEDAAKPVLDGFRTEYPFIKEISYERLRTTEQMQRLLVEAKAGRTPRYDIAHVSDETWADFTAAGMFPKPPFPYGALTSSLPADWAKPDPRAVDPEGLYIATSSLARGIAWNTKLLPKGQEPTGWSICTDPKYRGKVMYDPRAKLTALQHDPKTRDFFIGWLNGLVANKMVLQRGQSEGLEKLSAGEYPLFCGVNYHSTMTLVDQGAPIGFMFPDPYALEFGTQIHVVGWSQTPATTQLLVLWLATKGQPLMEKYAYRGSPSDPGGRKFPLARGKYGAVCDTACIAKTAEYDREHAKILGLPGQ
jgi:iron(III) transport system substrate-binding protein